MLDLHRFLGGAAVVFTGVHVVSLMLDSYVAFGVEEVLVPFTSSYRPSAVAWGIVGLYLLAAVEITSLLRRHLSKRLWRTTHLLSFPLFVVATVHGITAGTDSGSFLLRGALVVGTLAVAVAVAVRVSQLDQGKADDERRAAVRAMRHSLDPAVVRADDRGDDREPEPRAATVLSGP
jgi:predicted ferric reductase